MIVRLNTGQVRTALASFVINQTGGGGGSGTVTGPSSSIEDNFASFDDATGQVIKDSGFKSSDFDTAGAAAAAQGAAANYSDSKIENAINSGTTTKAPSEDAVYTALVGKLDKIIATERLPSGDYTLVLADAYKLKETDDTSPNNVTIIDNTFPTNSFLYVSQYNSGQTSFVAGGSMVIRSTSGLSKVPKQYAIVTIFFISQTECYLQDGVAGGDTLVTEGALIASATAKPIPVDGDYLGLMNSEASNILARFSWGNLKAAAKTYFDGLYPSGSGTSSGSNTGDQTISDATISTTDITTNNVSITKHGFAPKLPNDATKYLDGTGAYTTPSSATKYYTLTVQSDSLSHADGATYFFGAVSAPPSTTAQRCKIYIPLTGTIKWIELLMSSGAGIAGSNESFTCYVRLNDTTDTAIATVASNVSPRQFSNLALNISVVAGDYIEMKVICPTWATNPTLVVWGGSVGISY